MLPTALRSSLAKRYKPQVKRPFKVYSQQTFVLIAVSFFIFFQKVDHESVLFAQRAYSIMLQGQEVFEQQNWTNLEQIMVDDMM